MNETKYAVQPQFELSREADDLMNTVHNSIAQLKQHPWFQRSGNRACSPDPKRK